MPTYEYQARNSEAGCDRCRSGFDVIQPLADPPLTHCPTCGADVRKCFPRVAIGRSVSALDDRAKSRGFKKLKRLGRGEYEQVY